MYCVAKTASTCFSYANLSLASWYQVLGCFCPYGRINPACFFVVRCFAEEEAALLLAYPVVATLKKQPVPCYVPTAGEGVASLAISWGC
jgi:hypothetical protein